MLPAGFELHRPETIEDALALKSRHGEDASFYAGGTELLIALKSRVLHYPHLIDIKRIAALHGITARDDGGVSIGALATHRAISLDDTVRRRFGAYAALSDRIGNIRVRAAGTIGGNLCFGEPHADPPAMLCAFGAMLRLASADGERTVSFEQFVLGEFMTARGEDELLLGLDLPAHADGTRAAYRSFGQHARPAVGAAVVRIPDGAGATWRIWAGALSAKPVRLGDIEAVARRLGERADAAALDYMLRPSAAEAASRIDTYDDMHGSADYKRHLLVELVLRAAGACLS